MFQSKDYIYEIYRCGSFSAAARNLYIEDVCMEQVVCRKKRRTGVRSAHL